MNLFKVVIGKKISEKEVKISHNLYIVDTDVTSALLLAQNSFEVIAEKLGLEVLSVIQLDEINTDGEFKDRLLIHSRKIIEDAVLNEKVFE